MQFFITHTVYYIILYYYIIYYYKPHLLKLYIDKF